jgi:hypothetical protein
MIPSGYKEDTVFSAIPTDGSGDLSFTRASNGTRVNSAGLVEVCPWNLLEYSEDFGNAIYGFVDATITTNQTIAPNGTNTADKLTIGTATSEHVIYNTLYQTTLGQYTTSVYLKKGNSDYALVGDNGANGSNYAYIVINLNNGEVTQSGNSGSFNLNSYDVTSVGDGWYKCALTYTVTSDEIRGLRVRFSNSATPTVGAYATITFAGNGTDFMYLWGGQLNTGALKPYFPTTDRLNVPRLTYQNGGGGCPSLLLEKQSTNLAWPSENLTGWTSGGMTNSTNQTISPDGTQNGGKSTIGSTTRYYDVTTNGITTVNGTTYTTSFFAKKGTGIESIYFYQGDGGRIAKWNLNNGAYIGYAPADGYNAFASYGSESLGNGWYRFYATYTASSTSGNLTIGVSTNTNDSVTPISGNGTDFVYVWGLQYEASSYPTSYIPTTSASATRVADACFNTSATALIGQTEGTILLDCEILTTDTQDLLSIRPGGTSSLAIGTASNLILGYVIEGATVISMSFANYAINTRYKIALAYKNGECALYVNGTQADTDTTAFTFSTALSSLYLGQSQYFGKSSYENNEVVLFKTRLTNAELASLTTI